MSEIGKILFAPIPQNTRRPNADPFLRKNQIWFQKSLPPAISAQRTSTKPKNNLEQMTLNLLNPSHIDRNQLSPLYYKQNLAALQGKLHRASNQLPQSASIITLLDNETSLINNFNQIRLNAVAC